MPTYAQLSSEPPPGGTAWLAQITPGNMNTHLLVPLRTLYSLGPSAIGAAGDNNHVYGRHRSRDWDLSSRYCTNPSYGTTDARDKRGAGNIYRAVDIGIQGQPLWDACHRLDNAVRGGKLPGVAEWFGTFDGKTVVGWYEGHASSSDSSHLYHGHIGFWNESADDAATMQATYQVWAGTSTPAPPSATGDPDMFRFIDLNGAQTIIQVNPLSATGFSYVSYGDQIEPQIRILTDNGAIPTVDARTDPYADAAWLPTAFGPKTDAVRTSFIDAVAARVVASLPPGGGGGLTEAQVKAAVRAELDATKLAPGV